MTNNLHNNNNNDNNISFSSSIVTISKTSVNWPHYHSPMQFILNWPKKGILILLSDISLLLFILAQYRTS